MRVVAGLAENEANCTFAPAINPASERLLEDSTNLPADFQARQRFFAQQRKAHLQRIAAQSVGHLLSGPHLAGSLSHSMLLPFMTDFRSINQKINL